ncbi:AraC family transcriptional regulator [Paenibacillus sp. 598K]|uniref:AraC family transcriptional regulator n=1 Tax=Paenibacillus sp. 598K TaxID=1117987 RepID=UPI000FFA2F3D|nr:AraC family transcriptional regulator [Paenibacillus sp. 598K]GBF76129.1 AraC family transcriptional regulator [Paenibacillus sp. 598K]
MLRRKILVYLMLLSSVPVAVIGFISALYSSAAVTRQASVFNTTALRHVEKEMNTVFKQIDQLMLQYSYENTSLNRFAQEDFTPTNYMLVEELHTVLRNLHSGLDDVHEIAFYNMPYGKIMTSSGYVLTEAMFDDPAILEQARHKNRQSAWIDTRQTINDRLPADLITYTRPVINGASTPDGMLILYVDARGLSRKLLHPGTTDSSYMVLDAAGQVLLHTEPERIGTHQTDPGLLAHLLPDAGRSERQVEIRLDGVPTLLNINYVSLHDWFYVSAVAMSDLTREAVQLRNILLLISVALVGAAMLLSLQAGARLYRPVQRLMRRVLPSKASDAGDEVQSIIAYIDDVESSNLELQERIERYSRDVKNHMLLQLLLGNVKDMGPFADIGLNEPHLALYLVQLDQLELERRFSRQDQFLYYFAVQNIASELLPSHGHLMMLMIEPGLFAIIEESGASLDAQELRRCAEQLLDAIRQYLKLSCIISVNHSSSGAAGLSELYAGGRRALRYRFIIGDNTVVMSSELDAAMTFEAAALEQLEQQLIEAAQAEEWERGEQYVGSIVELLSEEYSLSREGLFAYFSYLLSSLLGVLRMQDEAIMDNLTARELVFDLSEVRTLAEMEDYFARRLFAMLRSRRRTRSAGSEEETIRRVVADIHDRYDEDLSLQSCAEAVGLNTFQLSRMFKKVMDMNFVDYVIHYRMGVAKQMLGDPQYKMQDISDKLRYGSVKSFIRVFKKVTGTTPGHYRKEASGLADHEG